MIKANAERAVCALRVATACLVACFALQASAKPYLWQSGDYLSDAELLSQWADTVSRHQEERSTINACVADPAACNPRIRGLRQLIERAKGLPFDKQLRLINYYVNRREYRYDRPKQLTTVAHTEGQRLRSQWRTLLDFVKSGGDCEDYASTKYFLMRELGVPAADLRIVVTYERRGRNHHAVLAVRRPDDSVWLLDADNTISKPPHRGYDYVYSINENTIWDHRSLKGQKVPDHRSLKGQKVPDHMSPNKLGRRS